MPWPLLENYIKRLPVVIARRQAALSRALVVGHSFKIKDSAAKRIFDKWGDRAQGLREVKPPVPHAGGLTAAKMFNIPVVGKNA